MGKNYQRENSIFWKCITKEQVLKVIDALHERELEIMLVERKKIKTETLISLDTSCCASFEFLEKQKKFIEENPIENQFQFYIINK